MPTRRGAFQDVPDTFSVVTGTGDLQALAASAGNQYAVHSIHVTNEGLAYKQFIVRNGTTGASPALGRIGVVNDVAGVTVNFSPAILVDALLLDAVSGTDSCAVSVIATKLVGGK